MGKISQGILGGFSGKVGNVIGATWKGISYIRIKPTSVANPRTEAQVNQRNKFAATLAFLKPNLAFIKQGYKAFANKQSAFNAAMSYVIKNAVDPDFSIDPQAALLSRGNLTGTDGESASVDLGILTVNWFDNSTQGNASPDDRAMLVAHNPSKEESIINLNAATREAGEATLDLPEAFLGDTVEVYLAFQKADGSMVSNSVHVSSVIVE